VEFPGSPPPRRGRSVFGVNFDLPRLASLCLRGRSKVAGKVHARHSEKLLRLLESVFRDGLWRWPWRNFFPKAAVAEIFLITSDCSYSMKLTIFIVPPHASARLSAALGTLKGSESALSICICYFLYIHTGNANSCLVVFVNQKRVCFPGFIVCQGVSGGISAHG
jgi:hypothetical protein